MTDKESQSEQASGTGTTLTPKSADPIPDSNDKQATNRGTAQPFDWYGKVFNPFAGRIMAVVFGVIAVILLEGPLAHTLGTDLSTLVPVSQCTVTVTTKMITLGEKSRGSETTANGEAGKTGSEPSVDTNRIDETASCQARAWSYAIQVIGNIATLFAVLWTLLALVRSDQRD